MFNLVGKRYLFLLISLAVIIPGVISLAIFHLNVGIDFAGGTSIEFRPDKNITIPHMESLLKPLNLQGLQVVLGADANLPANQTVWVRLSAQVDSNVQSTITKDLRTKYGQQLAVTFDDLTVGGKTVTIVTVTKFGQTPKLSDIRSLLNKLPNTTDVNKPASVLPATTPTPTISPTATATAKATGTPKATATPTPKPTATPKPAVTPTSSSTGPIVGVTPTPTPTATPTAVSNPANIPVKVVDLRQGTTTATITVLTRSVVDQKEFLKMRSLLLTQNDTYIQVLDNASVTGSVASSTTLNAFLAVLAASVLILLYIWFAFRKVPKAYRYGACAIIALLHDVLVVLGVFSILGWLFAIQIDALFITALLTVVGFSVHDTIVVFDRIRENMQRRTSETFEQVVNASLVQTMARSLNTSLTVLITLSALTLFGGTTIRSFTLALLIGIFSGTYSSIFNASMLLVIWEKGELGLWRLSRRSDVSPDGRPARELARTRG